MQDILDNTGAFDPGWYKDRYRDVAAGSWTPEDHYLTVGFRLGRGLSADCPALPADAPLPRALARRAPGAEAGTRIAISYCIPVMNRRADLEATLAANLAANLAHRDRIEFLVLAFEDTPEILPWLQAQFPEALTSGYLRAISRPALPQWHFGQAKNAFRPYLSGQLYSSLDADNFVTAEETRILLDALLRYGPDFIFHHFSGTWGDGSSGRITLPAWLYQRTGYDPTFLPRQFDEVDAILSGLATAPFLPLLHYDVATHVLDTDNIRVFLQAAGLSPRREAWPLPPRRAAANPKAASYVSDDVLIEAMQSINESSCFLKHILDPADKKRWDIRRQEDAARLVAHMEAGPLVDMLFGPGSFECLETLASDHPVAILQGDAQPMEEDGQVIRIDGPPHPGEIALIPVIGNSQTAEVLWLNAILKAVRTLSFETIRLPPPSGL
ncbi:hypothetical protein [Thalassococcus sp. S3]|uniref:hypothetical protein n=1 Tax=Thalassococcus sp. S3 TaxID=2017482 RepID=UPI001024454C|nr:hypothetical protein [Thalassococcus sp. S3]QBF34271.1 hypothetical protein CFI11_24100 [Thalassococcus sp. S3]